MARPWYPFYWSDYSGKTLHLTQGQHGAYVLLLRWIYTNAEPIPHELRYAAAQARLEAEVENTDFVLAAFFTRKGDFWHNERADSVLRDAEETHKRLSEQGKRGGELAQARLKLKAAQAPLKHTTTTTTIEKETKSLRDLSKKTTKPRTQIGEWEPDEGARYDANRYWGGIGRLDLVCEKQIEQFRDHHKSRGSVMADWSAAWRTWYRNAVKFERPANGGRSKPTATQNFLGGLADFIAENSPDRPDIGQARPALPPARRD